MNGATVIYSDDSDVAKLGTKAGLQVIGFSDLPLPPDDPQANMFKELEDAQSADTSGDIVEIENEQDDEIDDDPDV